MVSDNDTVSDEIVWDPEGLDEPQEFTRDPPPESFIADGETYTIIDANMEPNRFGDLGLALTLHDSDGDPIQFFVKYSKNPGSKWAAWITSLKETGVTVGNPTDLKGLSFVAKKTVKPTEFRDRDDSTKKIKRDVTTVTIASLVDGPSSNGYSEELVEQLIDAADGHVYAKIMSLVSQKQEFAPLRKGVTDRTLLARLVDEGRLVMNNKIYMKPEA
jgi:hypothetical protein